MDPFVVVFLAVPPVLVILHFVWAERLPFRVVLLTCITAGWLLVNGCTWWHFRSLGRQIAALENPPEEMVDAWACDGAPKVFALYFGWLPMLLYVGLLYVPARLISNAVRMARGGTEDAG